MTFFEAKVKVVPTLVISLMLLALGCDGSSTGGTEQTSFTAISAGFPSFIDRTILLEASERVGGTQTTARQFTFDLAGLDMVANGTFNDIEVSYMTPSSNDGVISIWNFHRGEWKQFGFPLLGNEYVFLTAITRHRQTVRELLGNAQSCVDENGRLILRSEGAGPRGVRVLRLREHYTAARPIGEDNVNRFDGLTYDGAFFWASSNLARRIYEIDSEGNVLSEFDSPGETPFGLAFDGENIWLADGSDRLLELSSTGTVLSEFTVPTDFPHGLAWGDGSLWLAEYGGSDPRTFRIDPAASSDAGVAVVTDVFQTPGGESRGLAWDGENLLVVSDGLYVMSVDGIVLESYPLPVIEVRGLAWDGECVVMFSRGPEGVGNSGQKLNWFTLR
jgi:hypothetical protein